MPTATAQQNRVGSSQAFHLIDWKDEESVVDFVENRWETREARRSRLERQWYINVAHYLGHQYLVWDETRGSLIEPEAPPWRVRLVANLIQGVSRKVVSKILRQKPIWTVTPATSEEDDIAAARISEKVLTSYWDGPLEMDLKMVDLFTWMTTCGNAFLRVIWDPRAGKEFAVDESDTKDKGIREAIGKMFRKGESKKLNFGDLEIEVASPFEIDPDPTATRFDRASNLIHSKARPIDMVKELFPKTAKDLEPESDESLTRHFERRIADLSGPSAFHSGTSAGAHEATEGTLLVHELWAEPGKGVPKGAYAVVAGGKLLHIQPNDYRAKGKPVIPYVHFQEIPVPGRLWGTCALEQALPLQAEYNRGRSQMIESRNLMSKPKWLVPKGANPGDMALTSEPGEVVEHTPGLVPTAWTPPPLPPYVPRLIEMARADIQDVTQIHDVTQAKAPPSVRSGVAIAQLQEQDDTVLAPTFMAIEHNLEKVGEIALEQLSRKVKETRLVKIMGKNGLVEAMQFTGKELVGPSKDLPGIDYFDVNVQMGSQFPLSRAGKIQEISSLLQAGVLNPEVDRDMILEMLELGTQQPLIDDRRHDENNSRRENMVLLEGFELDRMAWDNDEIHVRIHRQFQKTPDFLRNADEAAAIRFENHINQHLQALAPPPEQAPVEEELLPQEGLESFAPVPEAAAGIAPPVSPDLLLQEIAAARLAQGGGGRPIA